MSRKQKMHEPIQADFETVLGAIADEQKPPQGTLQARPFVKWVGGKRSILPDLLARMPKEYGTYHELFVGGAALFFAVQPKSAYLSDINFHLVMTFQAVRDDVVGLIRNLKIHESRHDKDYYYRARTRLFREKDPVKIAALVIYLNKTCYNGLYRVNKSGGFNVPMGDYKDPLIVDEENLENCSRVLQGVEITQHSFAQRKVKAGDFYYLDPPYHKTYTGYDGSGFGDQEHEALAAYCDGINSAGGLFMLSNSNTDFVRSLYKTYRIEMVAASRSVSCKGEQRGKENEIIVRNYE